MEKLYQHPAGLAASLTAGLVYIVCAAAIAFWPAPTMSLFASWFHGIDLASVAAPLQLTVGTFFIGLISTMLFMYITLFIFAWLYNQCYDHCKKRKWI